MNSKERAADHLRVYPTPYNHQEALEDLTVSFEQHAEEQRKWCFDRVKKVAIGMYFSSAAMSDNEILADFEDACLNATGEKE